MLAYVAVTRAQRNLDRGSVSWIDDHAQPQLPATGAASAEPTSGGPLQSDYRLAARHARTGDSDAP